MPSSRSLEHRRQSLFQCDFDAFVGMPVRSTDSGQVAVRVARWSVWSTTSR